MTVLEMILKTEIMRKCKQQVNSIKNNSLLKKENKKEREKII